MDHLQSRPQNNANMLCPRTLGMRELLEGSVADITPVSSNGVSTQTPIGTSSSSFSGVDEPLNSNMLLPAYLNPEIGIELVSEVTVQFMKEAPHRRHWYPGDKLPEFEKLAWNDLDRLFQMFSCKVDPRDWSPPYDLAPAPLREFQQRLRAFYLFKTKEIKRQIAGIPQYLRRIQELSDNDKAIYALQSKRQQRVEDRLAAGYETSAALEAFEDW